MTLLENTYRQLNDAGLATTGEFFSKHYLGKNGNWYAWQRHAGRDLSTAAAVNCLRTVRAQLSLPLLADEQKRILAEIAEQLLKHLKEHHFIADVCSGAD